MKNFKLRMSLFRIWFIKNIVLFLEILGITLFILVFTGVLPETTPIFGPLIMEIRAAEGDASTWVQVLSVLATCLTSVAIFLTKVKSIALSDIKSDKLKLSLVNANMYFNEKGKLVKRETPKKQQLATATAAVAISNENTAADADETEISSVSVATNLFTGIRNAVSEFFAIATVKLDDDEEKAKSQADKIIKDNNMEEAAKTVEELDRKSAEAFNAKVDKIVDETVDEATTDVANDDTINTAEKKDRINAIKKIGEWVKSLLHRLKKTDEEKAEIKAKKLAKKEAKKLAKAERKAKKEKTKVEAEESPKTVVAEKKAVSSANTAEKAIIKNASTQSAPKQATKTDNNISSFLKSIK